jgi:hypothetical protein
MFERVGRLAEATATNVSRRAFLGKFGRGAAAAAGIVAGLLVTSADVRADPQRCKPHCKRGENCISCGLFGPYFCCPDGAQCCG